MASWLGLASAQEGETREKVNVFSSHPPGVFCPSKDTLFLVFADHACRHVPVWPSLVSKPGNRGEKNSVLTTTLLVVLHFPSTICLLLFSFQSTLSVVFCPGLLLLVRISRREILQWAYYSILVRTKSQIVLFLNNQHYWCIIFCMTKCTHFKCIVWVLINVFPPIINHHIQK